MRKFFLVACAAMACASPAVMRVSQDEGAREAAQPTTFGNPLDLDYRFMPDTLSWRQAADPLVTIYNDEYYLFASKSGGYWHSPDMRHWTLVVPDGVPLEDYAPSVVTIGGRMYYTAHKQKAVYTTDDPRMGHWRKVADIGEYADPAFFLDGDGRLYLYHGSGLNGAISVVELDPAHAFKLVSGPVALMKANYVDHGWERSGEDNLGAVMAEGFRLGPYVEGSWMTKHDGVYYLQYAAPGTVWKTYADGVYTSRSPTSGFTYAPYSPFSYKPGGFSGSAGHSGTFQDKAGNWWRVVTTDISVRHKFERRLAIIPAGFDADGVMRANNYLADYPQLLPGVSRSPLDGNRAPWMLLSAGAAASASSSLPAHGAALAADEDIRTDWSAGTGRPGEWLMLDLGVESSIAAVQVNLADEGVRSRGRETVTRQRYVVEYSGDGRRWSTLVDRRLNERDAPHAYVELERAVGARYVRITNADVVPAGGRFAVRDLRVFGTSPIAAPPPVVGLSVVRNAADERTAVLRWSKSPRASGYIVRFGVSAEKLYTEYQVGDVDTLTMNGLNSGVPYWFAVDALGPGGVMRGSVVGPR
ncbi:MAG: family 43 glycosylhydrolase [Gemmatimonadaceae bacterium]